MQFPQDGSLSFPVLKQINLASGRVYKVLEGAEDEIYPSITRVLGAADKPQLDAWKERVGAEEAAKVSARAANRGQGLHRVAECYLSNVEGPTIWPHVGELWQYLRPWLDAHVTKVYAQEQDLVSRALGVAGRTDCICEIEGVLSVMDFKQSDKPKKAQYINDYCLQGTFYCTAIYEATARLPEQIIFPIVGPTGLQVFKSNPNLHFAELRQRIAGFYAQYDKGLDIQTVAGA